MGKIYQCIGRYAETPYTIKKTYIRVYCVEELCFYIFHNAEMIDESFAGNELIEWLAEECSLKDGVGTSCAEADLLGKGNSVAGVELNVVLSDVSLYLVRKMLLEFFI